jgi:hypothetical protein
MELGNHLPQSLRVLRVVLLAPWQAQSAPFSAALVARLLEPLFRPSVRPFQQN